LCVSTIETGHTHVDALAKGSICFAVLFDWFPLTIWFNITPIWVLKKLALLLEWMMSSLCD